MKTDTDDCASELSAALGWPGGISADASDWSMLLRRIAEQRVAAQRLAEAAEKAAQLLALEGHDGCICQALDAALEEWEKLA